MNTDTDSTGNPLGNPFGNPFGNSFEPLSLVEHFGILPDPRAARTRKHNLIDVLVIAVCAVICGAESFVDMEAFGKAKEAWFRERLELGHGIPSHDTFNRVFAHLDPEAFKECFISWVEALQRMLHSKQASGELKGQAIAVDGKTLRRSFNTATGSKAIHIVSVWSSINSLVLGQLRTDEKSNEITAIPALLRLLALEGCIVTIDAMGTQKDIARQIAEQRGDYILAVKGNQPTLRESTQRFFEQERQKGFKDQPHEKLETIEKDHGRIEKRRYLLVELSKTSDTAANAQSWLDPNQEWAGLNSIGMVECERTIGNRTSTEVRYYISSLKETGIEQFSNAVRSHWGIENSLHWVLDVTFREDDCRIRCGHAAENFAVLRHIALNLLKQEKTSKSSLRVRRKKAGWDDAYLERLLHG